MVPQGCGTKLPSGLGVNGRCFTFSTRPDLYKLIQSHPLSLSRAMRHYLKALCNVGYCLRTGFGVEKDMQAGLEYYYRAAKMQNSQAQLNLGFCFRNGNSGVQKDPIEAFHWFLSAAQQGHHNAERMVAHCYLDGTGIRTNLRDALRWAELAQQHEKSSNIVADVMLRCFWGRWCHHQFPSNLG